DHESKERLTRNVRRLIFLVNGVMRLERFKIEDIPVHPCRLYPADLIDAIIRDNEFEARRKNLRLEYHANRTLSMTSDPDLFTDALGNFLHNAVKYTDQGFVRVEVEEFDNDVKFKIIDSGPGISPSRQKELFQITRPSAHGGGGIGLAIAKRAVIAQGGKVNVESQIGKGSVFCITLPRVVKEQNLAEAV